MYLHTSKVNTHRHSADPKLDLAAVQDVGQDLLLSRKELTLRHHRPLDPSDSACEVSQLWGQLLLA